MKKLKRLKLIIFVFLIAISTFVLLSSYFFNGNLFFNVFILFFFFSLFAYDFFKTKILFQEIYTSIEDGLSDEDRQAFNYSNIGVLTYDEHFEITYQSELFEKNNLLKIGEKLFALFPQLEDLVNGNVDKAMVSVNGRKYEVIKRKKAKALLFKDVSEYENLKEQHEHERLVIGYLNFDNYDENLDYNDSQILEIANIKQIVYEYLKKHNVLFKQIRNNRLLLVMNEDVYEELVKDRFSILSTIRKKASSEDLVMTVSISIARGKCTYLELENLAFELLELAQARGGDQVVIRKLGEEVKYFGGSTEAREKQSKVKVRVVAHSIKELIQKASCVIIVGHKDADSDCVGSSIVMSRIASYFNKNVYIANKTGGIEPMSFNALKKYENELKHHNFISQNEALNKLDDNSLVIMLDHHDKEISGCKQILEEAKKVVIIDHHRRKSDLNLNTVLVYIEASSSSTVELVCEFIPYILKRFELNSHEANIAYLGVMIDTNRFRNRTGSRTFDVVSLLRKYGADPAECEELNEEPFENILLRSKIINCARQINKEIVIATLEDEIVSRSILSQACDELVYGRGIKASFVIAKTDEETCAISARSNGDFSVQRVMEAMNGGGHKTAAGLQVKNISLEDLEKQLMSSIENYLKEKENESDNA